MTLLGVVASAHVEAGGPAPTVLFSDDWNTADAATWDVTKWTTQFAPGSIVSGRGVMSASNSPDQIFNDVTITDFDALFKAIWMGSLSGYPELSYRIGNIGSSTTGYVAQIADNSGVIQLFKIPAYSMIGASSVDATLTAAGTRWFRIHVVGDHHQIRWWIDGGSEPGTWQIDVNDATYASGFFGFRNYSAPIIFDDLTITTP